MTTAVLLTATVTMESRARIGNGSTLSQKDRKRSHHRIFKHSSCSALDCLRKGSSGDTDVPLIFSFLEKNHAVDNYTWQ